MFKKNFITGLLVLIPLALTAWVLFSLIQFLDQIVVFMPDHLKPESLVGQNIPGFGLVLTFAITFIIGVVANNFLVRS